jgi:hypothetical protein
MTTEQYTDTALSALRRERHGLARALRLARFASAARDGSVADNPVLAGVVLALAAALVFGAFWPGVIPYDSQQIINEAKGHAALDWWTGVGTLMLQTWFALGLGVPVVWAATVAMNVVGIYGCLRLVLRRVPASFWTLAIVLWPTTYAQLSGMTRDSLYVGFSLMSFAALATIVREHGHRRAPRLMIALAFSVLAAIARQNGLACVFVVAVFATTYSYPASVRRTTVAMLAGAVASVGVYGGIHLIGFVNGVRNVHPERATLVYDLASISTITGHDYFPVHQLRALPPGGAAPPNVSETALRRTFRIPSVTSLRGVSQMDVGNEALAAREDAILTTAWESAIVHAPLAYVWDRVRLLASRLGFLPGARNALQKTMSGDNAGYPFASTAALSSAIAYLSPFVGNGAMVPFDLLWTYMLVMALAFLYIRRRWPRGVPWVASLLLAVAVNQLLLFFAAMDSSFRYDYRTPIIALLCVIYAGVAWRRERSDRKGRNALLAAYEPHLLAASRLDVDMSELDVQGSSERSAHPLSRRRELGTLDYNGCVDMRDPVAAGAQPPDDSSE